MRPLHVVLLVSLLANLFGMPPYAHTSETATAPELGLDDFIRLALENNPTVSIARDQIQAMEGRRQQAVSGYLPQLSANGQAARVHIDDLTPTDEDQLTSTGVAANQLIYDFGNTTGAISASGYDLEASRAQLNLVGSDLIYQVKAAYYSVLEKHYLILVANEQVSSYQMHYDRTREYFKAGVKSRIDVTNAQVELSNSRLQLLQSRFALKSARVALEKIIGTVPGNGTYIIARKDHDLKEFVNLLPPMPLSLEELLTKAYGNRPDIKQGEQQVGSAESALTVSRSEYWPTVYASATYDSYNTDLPTFQDQWTVGLGLNWEFFSGFRTRGKVVEAKSNLRSARSQVRDLRLTATQEVTDSFNVAQEKRESVFLADEILKLAEENLSLADQRYKSGLGDMIEYNDAQLRVTTARSNLVTTYYGYTTALANLDRAVGLFPDMTQVPEQKMQE